MTPRPSPLVTPTSATPRCTATVELASRLYRPYLFRVIVRGEPPHAVDRVYKIAAWSEESAAMKGLELFVNEFTPKAIVDNTTSIAPGAKREA
jgi:hypothetical protein